MQKRIQTTLHVLALSAALAWLPASNALAQLIAYEGFNYSADTSVGSQSGGYGWGGTWAVITDAAAALGTNQAGSLTYGTLPTTGGRAVIGKPETTTATTAQIQRQLPNTLTNILGGGGSIWISFLYQNLNADQAGLPGYRETGLRLMRGSTTNVSGVSGRNGTDMLDIGSPNTYPTAANFDRLAVFSGGVYLDSGIATPRGANPANTVFVVMRIDVDNTTATDTAYTWFNSSLLSQPTTGTALTWTTSDLGGINSLRFQAGNQNANGTNAVWAVDEIRVGLTWADVISPIPEPTILSLAGVAGLALLLWRRRN